MQPGPIRASHVLQLLALLGNASAQPPIPVSTASPSLPPPSSVVPTLHHPCWPPPALPSSAKAIREVNKGVAAHVRFKALLTQLELDSQQLVSEYPLLGVLVPLILAGCCFAGHVCIARLWKVPAVSETTELTQSGLGDSCSSTHGIVDRQAGVSLGAEMAVVAKSVELVERVTLTRRAEAARTAEAVHRMQSSSCLRITGLGLLVVQARASLRSASLSHARPVMHSSARPAASHPSPTPALSHLSLAPGLRVLRPRPVHASYPRGPLRIPRRRPSHRSDEILSLLGDDHFRGRVARSLPRAQRLRLRRVARAKAHDSDARRSRHLLHDPE